MRLLTLHDILVAWRDGAIGLDEALSLAQIETEGDLREAAMHSGVLPMRPSTDEEREHQARVDAIVAKALDDMTALDQEMGMYNDPARPDQTS